MERFTYMKHATVIPFRFDQSGGGLGLVHVLICGVYPKKYSVAKFKRENHRSIRGCYQYLRCDELHSLVPSTPPPKRGPGLGPSGGLPLSAATRAVQRRVGRSEGIGNYEYLKKFANLDF